MSSDREAAYHRLRDVAKQWTNRESSVYAASHQAGSTVVQLEGVIESVDELPEWEKAHPGGALALTVRATSAIKVVVYEEVITEECGSDESGIEAELAGLDLQVDVRGVDQDGSPSQWTSAQREQVLALVDSVPWGDIDGGIRTVEEGLRLAMEATAGDYLRWENEAFELTFGDEFSLPPAAVRNLNPADRLAYVGRLIMSVASVYGMPTESPEPGVATVAAVDDPGSIAELVHALNDIQVGVR